MAIRFRRREAVDDLVQMARIGLLQAITRFDPSLGHPYPGLRPADHHRRAELPIERVVEAPELRSNQFPLSLDAPAGPDTDAAVVQARDRRRDRGEPDVRLPGPRPHFGAVTALRPFGRRLRGRGCRG
ncbi:MAG: hypothetical protein LC792_16160 [Actinobacteria bacterium]|nr:hypothetical protein [Actinomycetota bacterium]